MDKKIYTCVNNDSHVFCDVGDSGDVEYWRDKAVAGFRNENNSQETIDYLNELTDKEIISYIMEFFLIDIN